MSIGIIKMIDKDYSEFKECLDLAQIINICKLYKIKNNNSTSIGLSDIELNSPDFKFIDKNKINGSKSKKGQSDILKSKEFVKKYSFFIRIIYACFKINVEMFDINDNILTLKNNYQLVKSMKQKKKLIIDDHIQILKEYQTDLSKKIGNKYNSYVTTFLNKIKIIDKITGYIDRLVESKVLDKTDNLLTLILPYFYTYTEFIEEYH